MKTYRELIVWQKSMELVKATYKVSRLFPEYEKFGLSSQIQRCIVSVPSNIAEGYCRNSLNDYIRFLNIATGSLYEFQTQIEIASNLNYIEKDTFNKIFEDSREIERMMSSLIRKLKQKR
ncbi:MAG: four helix bundle protein [Urechidicola sp.]|nr:four helix bundle protein [Urechidicola sp.]